jgi:hypothetical protein
VTARTTDGDESSVAILGDEPFENPSELEERDIVVHGGEEVPV